MGSKGLSWKSWLYTIFYYNDRDEHWNNYNHIFFYLISGLVGILFPTKKEPAFSVIRMGLATGYLVGFSLSLFLETQALLWIAFSLVTLSLITYSILVFKTLSKEQLFPYCYKIKKDESEINENPKISE